MYSARRASALTKLTSHCCNVNADSGTATHKVALSAALWRQQHRDKALGRVRELDVHLDDAPDLSVKLLVCRRELDEASDPDQPRLLRGGRRVPACLRLRLFLVPLRVWRGSS